MKPTVFFSKSMLTFKSTQNRASDLKENLKFEAYSKLNEYLMCKNKNKYVFSFLFSKPYFLKQVLVDFPRKTTFYPITLPSTNLAPFILKVGSSEVIIFFFYFSHSDYSVSVFSCLHI